VLKGKVASFLFARWLLQFETACFICGAWTQIFPFPGGHGPQLTQCVSGPNNFTSQMTCHSVQRFKHKADCTNMTDDGQTDRPRYEGTRMVIFEIACARAVPPNNIQQWGINI